jgi:hypothetical protein
MSRTAISRTLTVATATGVASLVFCAPASAMYAIPYDDAGGNSSSWTQSAQPADSGAGLDPSTVAAGVVLVVVGAGAVVLVRRRHHSGHMAHPV